MKKNILSEDRGVIRLKTREAAAGYLFAVPSLLGFSLFFMIPFVISLYYCFTRGIGGSEFAGLDNFKELLNSGSFLLASKNTLIFNAISVPLIILLSFFFALLLNGKIKGVSYFRSFFILPLVLPVASVILVWQIMFDENGALSGIAAFFGIGPVDWMRTRWSVVVLVMLYIWKNCGYNVVLFLAGLANIPAEYYEAARMDGAGRFRCMTSITIPFLAPTAFFVFIISIINSFKVFREAYLLAGSYPDMHIYLLQHFMNNNFFNLSYQKLTTAAFILTVVIAFLVSFLFKMESRFGRNIG
ncbi:MAG: sugar ABC transporter permease [Clostridia bacterium]|nr:sugar ABC transporter permease [Clostridia bacterium]